MARAYTLPNKLALGIAEVSIRQNLYTFLPFLLAFYCTEQFCRHQNHFQKRDTLLYTSLVNLVSIQVSLRSTEASLFFLLFTWRCHKVLAFHQNFHVFSRYVACYFLHRQGDLSSLERLYEEKEEIARPDDISDTWYIAFSKRFIG